MIPIAEAVAVLARAPASVDPQVRVARALDVLASLGLPVPPERFVLRAAASDVSLLDLLVSVMAECPQAGRAVVERARAIAASTGLPEEAAHAFAARRTLLDPAAAIAAYLPREVVLQNEFRREELVRAWAARIDVPIEARGAAEPADKSQRALERLDYRRIRADEERLAIERKVLAEHAAAVREKQRLEAEALASAQRE